jgi:hypothetical protein
MKNIGMIALGLFLFSGSLEAAELKFSGDFRVRGIYTDNLFDANDENDDQEAFADGRFRLKIAATAGITTGVVVVDFTNAFSAPDNVAYCPPSSCGTGNYRFGSANFGNDYKIVGVREAHLKLDFGDRKFVFGRKQFKLGHGLILDDTLDAAAGKIESGGVDAMLAWGKLQERNFTGTPGATGSDADLYIAKIGFEHGPRADEEPAPHKLGLFVTYLKDRTPVFFPADDNAYLWTGGITADALLGPIDLAFEVDAMGGELNNLAAPTIDLSGLNILLGGTVAIGESASAGLTFLHTRGFEGKPDEINVTGISGNFVFANILVNDNLTGDREGMCPNVFGARVGSGATGCIAGPGITAVKLAVNLPDPQPGCDTEVAVILAKATERPVPGADRDLGVELDANMIHQLDENLTMNVNLGYLIAGDFWKFAGGPGDDRIKAVAALNYSF